VEVILKKRFLKDLAAIPTPYRQRIETFVFQQLSSVQSMTDLGNIEKMRGYTNYYKARFGDYRIGFSLEGKILKAERVLHRKEIYKFFP
jgi:mRNA interferase RelE/StbE